MYDISRYKVLIYFRGSCFTIATLYWFYQFHVANYNGFGIHFRYLTIWGLTGNVIVTGLLLRQTLTEQTEKYFFLILFLHHQVFQKDTLYRMKINVTHVELVDF